MTWILEGADRAEIGGGHAEHLRVLQPELLGGLLGALAVTEGQAVNSRDARTTPVQPRLRVLPRERGDGRVLRNPR